MGGFLMTCARTKYTLYKVLITVVASCCLVAIVPSGLGDAVQPSCLLHNTYLGKPGIPGSVFGRGGSLLLSRVTSSSIFCL